jgi:non-heme chloroperoxidase
MPDDLPASTLIDSERHEIERANASGLTPVVFIHGLWLLSSSWDRWRQLFAENGYATIAPRWPGDTDTVPEARVSPDVFANKTVQQVADHYLEAIRSLDKPPAVVGHSFGGLIAQKIAGLGAARATVSIDNAPFKGVLPLPISSLRSAAPVIANPANLHRSVQLTFEQFKFGWTNNLDDDEARMLFDTYHVPSAGTPLFQAAVANFNPFGGETKIDTTSPQRGPLLILAGANDNTVPLAITRASYRLQSKNPGVTEIIELPGRGHSLVIDGGWEEVARLALKFINEHYSPPSH